ncbi:hypothetical protein GCM10009550_67780 [Actinocorallia libanotica]|uniref:Uncharacterized protein n=1 Tax=Actinocorallia libanotica TaxID=46162 RepID=A0ABP4CCS3_9ACTN
MTTEQSVTFPGCRWAVIRITASTRLWQHCRSGAYAGSETHCYGCLPARIRMQISLGKTLARAAAGLSYTASAGKAGASLASMRPLQAAAAGMPCPQSFCGSSGPLAKGYPEV